MKKFILPAILLTLGVGSALATQVEKRSTTNTPVQGYIFNPTTNQWDRSTMCDTQLGPICTVNNDEDGEQLWGTSGPDVDHPETANVEVYKVPN